MSQKTDLQLPPSDIFWEHVASNYLTVRDLSFLEVAVNNHELRHDLHLPMPLRERSQSPNTSMNTTLNSSSESWSLSHATNYSGSIYEQISLEEENVVISSLDMESWCQRRRLKLHSIILRYDPTPELKVQKKISFFKNLLCFSTPVFSINKLEESTNGFNDEFDFMNYVEVLVVDTELSSYSYDALISRLHCIKSFSTEYRAYNVKDTSVLSLIHQCKLNAKRFKDELKAARLLAINSRTSSSLVGAKNKSKTISSLPIDPVVSLEHITLDPSWLSQNTIELALQSLTHLRSVKLEHCSKLSDKTLRFLAYNVKNLECLSIYGGRESKPSSSKGAATGRNNGETSSISDAGLEAFRFTGQELRSVTFYGCPNITTVGLSMLLISSLKSLTELVLGNMADLTQERDVTSLVCFFTSLQVLGLYDNAVKLSDKVLHIISLKCPNMRSLTLHTNPSFRNDFTTEGIHSLLKGCRLMETLNFGWCEKMSKSAMRALAKAYSKTLKSFTIFGCDIEADVFASCKFAVKVVGGGSYVVNTAKAKAKAEKAKAKAAKAASRGKAQLTRVLQVDSGNVANANKVASRYRRRVYNPEDDIDEEEMRFGDFDENAIVLDCIDENFNGETWKRSGERRPSISYEEYERRMNDDSSGSDEDYDFEDYSDIGDHFEDYADTVYDSYMHYDDRADVHRDGEGGERVFKNRFVINYDDENDDANEGLSEKEKETDVHGEVDNSRLPERRRESEVSSDSDSSCDESYLSGSGREDELSEEGISYTSPELKYHEYNMHDSFEEDMKHGGDAPMLDGYCARRGASSDSYELTGADGRATLRELDDDKVLIDMSCEEKSDEDDDEDLEAEDPEVEGAVCLDMHDMYFQSVDLSPVKSLDTIVPLPISSI